MGDKHFVYILRSLKDGKRYIGSTRDLDRRLTEHNSGLIKSTGSRRPLELLYYEVFEKNTALKRERFFKSGQGREFLKNLEY